MQAQRHAFFWVTAVIFIISSALCGIVLAAHEGDPVTFAHTGTIFTNRTAQVPDPNLTVGYDGQFVYYIARDGADAVKLLDGPSFRLQRILLPLLGRVVAFGQPDLVPWTLLIINLIAHSVGAGLMAYLLTGYGASGILGGLTYGLWIGMFFTVRLTLTEALCFALAIGAVTAYQHKQYRWTVILLMLSTLAKEIGLVFALGIAIHAFWQKQRGWAVLIFAVPLLLLLMWWGVLYLMFGDIPTQYPAARHIQLIPFLGMFTADTDMPELVMLIIWMAVPTVLLLIAALWRIWRQRQLNLTTALILPTAGFMFTIPAVTWGDPVAAYRVGMPIVISGLLFAGENHPKAIKWMASLWLTSLLLLPMLSPLWLNTA